MLPLSCPKCYNTVIGWNMISSRTGDDRYSFTKGIIGTALVGPLGAIAGVGGKKGKEYITYQCPHCGYIMEVENK